MTNSTPATHPPGQQTFFSANDLKALLERQHQAKEAEQKKHVSEAEAAKNALIDELKKPIEISEEQVEQAVVKFRAAAEAGQTEMTVFTFPAQLCTDGGRKINNALDGWQDTLVGKPRSIYEAWQRYLKDKGYLFHAKVLNYPQGMLGDIGLIIVWATKDT